MNLAFVFKRDDVSASKRTFFNVDEFHVLARNEFVSNFDAGFHDANIVADFYKKSRKKTTFLGSSFNL